MRRNPVATGQPTFEIYVSATLISTDATYAPTSRIVASSSTRRNTYDNTPTAPTLTMKPPINVYDRVDFQAGGQFNTVVEVSDTCKDFEWAELAWTELGTLLMYFDVFG